MSQDAADVPPRVIGELAVAALVEEQRLAVLPQRVVTVHARTVVAEDRLGHESGRLAPAPGLILHDVLEFHHVIAGGQEGGETVVDLLLTSGADLVVGAFDLQPRLQTGAHHGVTDVGHLVGGGDREVAALELRLVALIAALLAAAGVPRRLVRVDGVTGGGRGGLVLHGVEEVEFRLSPDVTGVGDTGGSQVVLSLGGDRSGVAGEPLVRERVHDREVDDQGLLLAERVEEGCGDVGDELHVGFVDRCEPADRGAVEHQTVGQGVLLESDHRDREVLHDARQVAEADVDECDPLLLNVGEGLGRVLEHGAPP